MRKLLVGDGCCKDWMRETLPEQLERGVDAGAAAQHTRAQGNALERLAIPADRRFIAGAAGDVGGGVGRQALGGEALIVADIDNAGGDLARMLGHGCSVVVGRKAKGVSLHLL